MSTPEQRNPVPNDPDPPFVNIPVQTILYRGVKTDTQQPYYKPNQPQWFSHDSNHDYIESYLNTGSGFKVTYKVAKPIRVINLKNEMVRNLLNVAIDRLQTTIISDLLTNLKIEHSNNAYKNNLKSTYGGITFYEQFKAVYQDNMTIKERVTKIARFPEFIVNGQNLTGFRHSVDRYDRLLCYLIVQVFPVLYEYFKVQPPIMGWIHNEWQTPWHDKYKDGSQIFKTEVALFLPNYSYLAVDVIMSGGARKLRQITPKLPEKLKNRGTKKSDGAQKDSTRVRHSSRKEPRAPL
jgi:hypothetical protein